MRMDKRWYHRVGRVVAGLWLIGWVALASGVDHQHSQAGSSSTRSLVTTSGHGTHATIDFLGQNLTEFKETEVPSVLSLESVSQSPNIINSSTATTAKIELPMKETEGKKKSVSEFKSKTEAKYQKVKDEDKSVDSTLIEKLPKIDNVTKASNVPFLLHGVPLGMTENVTEMMGKIEESEMGSTSRGRALNVSAPEPTNSLHANLTDLSDVSMDEEDKQVEGGEYVATRNETNINVTSTLAPTAAMIRCIDGNETYAIGEKIVRGCEEKCVCAEGGKIEKCQPVCQSPTLEAGKNKPDPYCSEQLVGDDGCCAVVVCADSEPEPDESCIIGNETLARGERYEDGCLKVCVCEGQGDLKCQPRCPPNETTSGVNQHDRCVALSDPRDPCCTITLCDVTLGDHEIKAENAGDLSVNLTNVKVLNSTTIKLKMSSELSNNVVVEISEDNHVWRQQKPDKNGIITNLEPAHSYFVRVTEGGRTGPALQVFLPAEVIKTNITEKMDKSSCSHRGKLYKIGAEWYDECISVCVCGQGAKIECVTIECPTDFGLDVLDPQCLDWETVPSNFVPKAPQCCPQEVRCRNNGSCMWEGQSYDNWSELPSNVTGCERRCYCDMGNVSCQAACPPVPALPPPNLQCPSNQAILAHLPGDDCCSHWVCDRSSPHSSAGMDVTTTYPLSTDHKIAETTERTNNKSSIIIENGSQESTTSTSTSPSRYTPHQIPNHDLFHYPMDPGHPTIPYNGPYNPDYKPTQPSLDDVFHLSENSEKPIINSKDKIKSKSDSKKPLEPIKPHKEISGDSNIANNKQSSIPQRFPGPFAPDRYPNEKLPGSTRTKIIDNPNMMSPTNPNKLPPLEKATNPSEQPQFIPLEPNPQIPGGPFVFVPSNGENIPATHFDNQYENPDAGPPYGGPGLHVRPDLHDPNFVMTNVPKKKVTGGETKPKPGGQIPGKTGLDQILPEELYHLISQAHPGLTHLEHAPPQGHSGLYELHRQIAAGLPGNNKNVINNKPVQRPAPPPHIVAQKDENGQTTYHVHTSQIPNSPQQIEELLAHISQHDSNLGPYQYHPDQVPIGGSTGIGLTGTQPGPPHLNHPFAAQPNQSGMDHHNLPAGFPVLGGIPGFPGQGIQAAQQDDVIVKALEALDDSTIRIVFTVPPTFVGLEARVELRYTSDKSNIDPLTWKSQVFLPPHNLIATPQLEFELDGLEASTDYKIRVTVNLQGFANSPSSKIYSVRTLDRREEIPPQIPVNAELRLVETNSTWISVMWKKFTEYEMRFIDGVQLRYKEHDSKVYAATPLIHRAVDNYVIENLKPATNYEIGIYIIPFPGQSTELISDKTIHVVTAVEPDPYSFDVKVKIESKKSTGVEVSWSGVPYPEDKYVNIYRAIYQSDSGKEDTSTFKIAKRDSPAKTFISDLKPGTRYRLWIEVYLTNGRIKKSNVEVFVTKPGVILPAGISQALHEGDYYGPLVIVAIVASLAILSTLILLMMLMKRRSSSKADISPRKTTAAYDNPSYKTCEDAGPIANGRNKTADHEMATINVNTDAKETA